MNWRSDNSGFFAGLDKVGTFLFANFIWAVLSLTIVGIPFATLGLFAMMNEWVQDRQPEFFRVFGGSIRNYWRKAIPVVLIDVVLGGLLFLNFSIFQFMDGGNILAALSRTMTISVAIVLVMSNIYVWSLMSLLDLSSKNLIKLSLILVLTYPIRSVGVVILVLLPVVVSLFLPPAFFLFVTVSITAYIAARGTWWVLNTHFSAGEIQSLMNERL